MKINPKICIKRKKPDNQLYNKPFIERELKAAIKQQKNTAPWENNIHPQVRKIYHQKH